MTSLHVAVLRQEIEIVETIDIVLQDKEESQKLIYIDQLDELSNTALSYAISIASTSIVRTLVRARAKVNRRDRLRFTPLMDACYRGDEKVISCLINYGADVTIRNNFDVSALEYIMIGESESKVNMLRRLAYFADRPQLNKSLSYAFNTSKEFYPILLQYSADPEYTSLLNKESKKPTDIIEGRERLQSETEPVSVPVAWYRSNPIKSHQRRIYQVGQ
jgi:ankyrin repeat protein